MRLAQTHMAQMCIAQSAMAQIHMAQMRVLNYYYYLKNWQCKAGRGRVIPYQSEDPSPTLPTYRGKEEKGKIVEDK